MYTQKWEAPVVRRRGGIFVWRVSTKKNSKWDERDVFFAFSWMMMWSLCASISREAVVLRDSRWRYEIIVLYHTDLFILIYTEVNRFRMIHHQEVQYWWWRHSVDHFGWGACWWVLLWTSGFSEQRLNWFHRSRSSVVSCRVYLHWFLSCDSRFSFEQSFRHIYFESDRRYLCFLNVTGMSML